MKQGNIGKFKASWKKEGFRVAALRAMLKISRLKNYRLVNVAEQSNIIVAPKSVPGATPVVVDDKSYQLPDLLTESKTPKRVEVVACAFRPKTAKGGPGAVLTIMKEVFGNVYNGTRIKYFFNGPINGYPVHLEKAIEHLPDIIKVNFRAAYYIQRSINVWSICNKKTDVFFVCHDVGSAYGAYLSGKKYVLIFHQQGAINNEAMGAGLEIPDDAAKTMRDMERLVMENAQTVYFPSNGAKEMYIETCGYECSKVHFGKPLYNTIPDDKSNVDPEAIKKEFGLDKINRDKYEVFLSVGDYNMNKGIDRIPPFLNYYASKTKKKILWIVAGNKQSSGVYEKFLKEKKSWKFESVIIGARIPHEKILGLMNHCDYFIMFHRKSIFDLAILEAMRAGLIPVLTPVGGNPEFNVNDNVVFVDLENYDPAVSSLLKTDLQEGKQKNKDAFESTFSQEQFYESYGSMMDEELEVAGCSPLFKVDDPQCDLKKWKDKFKGETVVICGGGSSLKNYKPIPNAKHIALNSALFYPNVKYDFLFMQDYPLEASPYKMADYNEYECKKFYGKITNAELSFLGFKKDEQFIGNKGEIQRYELSPRLFDASIDNYFNDLGKYCMVDAQSVLFSALQFCVFAGFKKINLIGVDFSDTNFDNPSNPSKYARSVVNNLVVFKRQLREYDESIQLNVIASTNRIIRGNLGMANGTFIVTGMYTKNYASCVRLQKNSCLDNYQYDYRFITDEEWRRAKTSSDFAFYGGNTIKTQLVIDKIKEHWGQTIIVTDADIIYLKRTEEKIREELLDNDMLFLRERLDSEDKFEKTPLNINIGFVVIRCNEKTLAYWERVQERTRERRGWDQEEANLVLMEEKMDVKWALLSDYFTNGNDINKDNVTRQLIASACGTIAKRNKLSKTDYLNKVLLMARGLDKVWFDGTKLV